MKKISFYIGFSLVFIFIGLVSLGSLSPVPKAIALQNQTKPMGPDRGPVTVTVNAPPWLKVSKRDHDTVRMGQGRIIGQDEEANDAVVVGADLTIYGTVNGDAVCIGGNLNVGPQAIITGDLVNIGGKSIVNPSAKIYGDQVNLVGFPFDFLKILKGVGENEAKDVDQFGISIFGGPMGFVAKLLRLMLDCVKLSLILLFALIMIVFMPRQFNNIEEYLSNEFPRCTLLGIACMIGFPIIVILFIITLVGIMTIPFLLLALLVSSLMGYIVFSRILGRRLLPERHIMLQIFIGLLLLASPLLIGDLILFQSGDVYAIVGLVFRIIGKIIYYGVNFIGLGAVIYSLWGKRGVIAERGNRPNDFSGSSGNGDTAML